MLIAWSPYLFDDPSAVIHKVFGYKSSYGLWGFSWLSREVANAWPTAKWINTRFSQFGSPLVMVVILVFSVMMNRLPKKPGLYAQVGMVYLLFFSITSGFAVQYLAWLTPWVAELGALPVSLFVMTGSVFLLVVYNYWALGMPWYMGIAYPWSQHQYFQAMCWVSVVLLAFVGWHRIRAGRGSSVPLAYARGSIKVIGLVCFATVLVYPAFVHMRRDSLSATPVYAEDEALYTEADAMQNLVTELTRHGRISDAAIIQARVDGMNARAQSISKALWRSQPWRSSQRTPEDYVNSSLYDYNNGDFVQCVTDATESLKLRPDMPAAWYNISLCNAQMGNWDAAVAAAREAVLIEPESELVQQNLDWVLAGKQRSFGQ